MNNYFKTGLLALTLAFGVTSCDKQDSDGAAVNALSLEAQGLASKVKFNEDAGLASPKGYQNLTAKNHADFDHIYGDTQVLTINNAAGNEAFSGDYTPNEISTIGDIILANGNGYVATSMTASYTSEEAAKVVIGYLPYTSTKRFDLSAGSTINLEASLLRGFLIVDGELEALGGNRITSATANDVELIRDADGDFYGYLLAGPHDVVVNYDLNDEPTSMDADIAIAIGSAYTFELALTAETVDVVDSVVTSGQRTGLESEIGSEGVGRDINDDGDLLDTLTRTVTTTTPTLNGDPSGPGVDDNGPWSVVLDTDILIEVGSEESTEVLYESSVNADGDLYDLITRVVTTTTTSLDGVAGTPTIVNGDWTILEDRSALGVTNSNDGVTSGTATDTTDAPFVVAEYSAYGPAFVAQLADFTQERTVSNADANLDPDVVLEALSRVIAVTNEVTLDAEIGVEGVTTYSATIDGEVLTHDVAIDALDAPFVAATYSVWGPAFVAQIDGFTQTREVSNSDANLDSSVVLEALSRDIVVSALTVPATAGVVGSITYSADNGIAFTHSVEIPALPLEDVDVSLSQSDFTEAITGEDITWTGSGDAAGKSFGIGAGLSNNTYFYILDGVNSAEFSGADDDAAYYAAVDAAIAAIQAQING